MWDYGQISSFDALPRFFLVCLFWQITQGLDPAMTPDPLSPIQLSVSATTFCSFWEKFHLHSLESLLKLLPQKVCIILLQTWTVAWDFHASNKIVRKKLWFSSLSINSANINCGVQFVGQKFLFHLHGTMFVCLILWCKWESSFTALKYPGKKWLPKCKEACNGPHI